ncbi:M20 aminoacylase family protein [Taklimakanibacter albus]|uniref:Amidohydrolase n=1 Tax=Taklimakanibacter albus TaxID=2800327 RepID=A0ACC5R8L7_9HYPH|nr:M20 aminoacylase family protein [Aestuariivirga sp. YIM B02566]MBK1868957.1 amidohydrolase [Aestuariivirga sp. YIM B02566]
MPLLNNVSETHPEITGWRRQLHSRPELMFDVHETAKFVAGKLRDFGCDEVVTGIGRTGVVGLIRGRHGDGPVIGLRSDMDALPITEATGLDYASQVTGVMHACGHDGHTAMLLGAARHLCETRNFKGAVAVIFQPAEEGGGGGREMVEDGMMERFAITQVFGLHNEPGVAVGRFSIRAGAFMAAFDEITITVTGRGGHAAMPHQTIDPIFIGAQIITALQGIVARNTDPLDSLVVSITKFHAGDAMNVIPPSAELAGTVRTLSKEVREAAETRIRETVEGVAKALGGQATLSYVRKYPVTVNHSTETQLAIAAARDVMGHEAIETEAKPIMGAEDFAFMLEARPGAMIFLGNGDTAWCHNPAYDFNDEAIPVGVSYWVRLTEMVLKP